MSWMREKNHVLQKSGDVKSSVKNHAAKKSDGILDVPQLRKIFYQLLHDSD